MAHLLISSSSIFIDCLLCFSTYAIWIRYENARFYNIFHVYPDFLETLDLSEYDKNDKVIFNMV